MLLRERLRGIVSTSFTRPTNCAPFSTENKSKDECNFFSLLRVLFRWRSQYEQLLSLERPRKGCRLPASLPTHEPCSFSLRTDMGIVSVVSRRYAHPGCVNHPVGSRKGSNWLNGVLIGRLSAFLDVACTLPRLPHLISSTHILPLRYSINASLSQFLFLVLYPGSRRCAHPVIRRPKGTLIACLSCFPVCHMPSL